MDSLFETYVLNGGPLMVPLIFCSFVLVGGVIQGILRLRRDRVAPSELLDHLREGRLGTDYSAIEDELVKRPAPVARAAFLAIDALALGSGGRPEKQQIDDAVEDATAHVADDMYEDLNLMSTLYTVAPLLGLLGTILGMISAFQEFGAAAGRDLSVLSGGIQQALVTTVWGISISIAAYVTVQMFQTRIRTYERGDMPRGVHEFLKVAAELASGDARDTPASGVVRERGEDAR